jgi:quercetin dioxygenase-like cupin family protein
MEGTMGTNTDTKAVQDAWRTIANPASGETITFVETVEEAHGDRVVMHITVAAGGGPTPHIHRHQTEAFEVLVGTVDLYLGKRQIALPAGATAVVLPGMLHHFRNNTQIPATICVTVTPPGNVEAGMRATFHMMREGLLPKQPLVAALLLLQSDIYLAPMPQWIYWPLIGTLGRLGRWTGGARTLARYGVRPEA